MDVSIGNNTAFIQLYHTLGPDNSQTRGPLNITGRANRGCTFNTKVSVAEISTWVCLRSGPRTRTFSIGRSEGPIKVTLLLAAIGRPSIPSSGSARNQVRTACPYLFCSDE